MKKIIQIIILSLIVGSTFADECYLTDGQMSMLFFSYSFGREYNMGLSMSAIAMHESNLGQWNINLQDPSASPWHVTIDKAVDYLGWEQNGFNMNRAAQRLINDPFLGAQISANELMNWYHKVHRNAEGHERWRRTWASYNAGYNWNSDTGQRYADIITENIRLIQRCGWLEEVTHIGGMRPQQR